jgi:hypothetical protein
VIEKLKAQVQKLGEIESKAYGLATTPAVRTKKCPTNGAGKMRGAHSKIRRGAVRSKLRFDSENF